MEGKDRGQKVEASKGERKTVKAGGRWEDRKQKKGQRRMVEAKADGKKRRGEMGAEGRNEGKGRCAKVEGRWRGR